MYFDFLVFIQIFRLKSTQRISLEIRKWILGHWLQKQFSYLSTESENLHSKSKWKKITKIRLFPYRISLFQEMIVNWGQTFYRKLRNNNKPQYESGCVWTIPNCLLDINVRLVCKELFILQTNLFGKLIKKKVKCSPGQVSKFNLQSQRIILKLWKSRYTFRKEYIKLWTNKEKNTGIGIHNCFSIFVFYCSLQKKIVYTYLLSILFLMCNWCKILSLILFGFFFIMFYMNWTHKCQVPTTKFEQKSYSKLNRFHRN